MTMVSYSHEFIFIHNIKVAGNSVKRALSECIDTPYLATKVHSLGRWIDMNRFYRTKFFPERMKILPKHLTALAVRDMLSKKTYESFYKFIFVRNPWDWQVSLFHYILDHPEHNLHEMVSAMKGYEEFVHWRVGRKVKGQKRLITDENGNLIVDFVGRYERLADDFKHVCDTIGVDARLPHLNKSDHRDYRSYYNDEMIEMISNGYREDIEFFGYSFDNS
jgi:hypothetical protein